MASNDEVRLSALSTQWTLIVRAHAGGTTGREALAELLPRYCAAVYRYLLGVLRDEAAVEELCQEFAYRFTRGDFRHARPEKGRFRDYVKTSIIHLVGEYRRKQRAAEKLLPFDSRILTKAQDEEADSEAAFREEWRQELLNRTWAALQEATTGPQPTLYDVLRKKAEDPTRSSAELACALGAEHDKELTVVNVRQMVHRARQRFAELLRVEVAASVPTTDPTEVDAELAELGLLVYVQ